jgi:hypothetical protein
MPFMFSDEAYACTDREVRDVILFVHRIRAEVRKSDTKTKASPSTQWQAEHSHYLHRYLHANVLFHISAADKDHWARVATHFNAARDMAGKSPETLVSNAAKIKDPGKRTTSWSLPVAKAFNALIDSVRFGGSSGDRNDAGGCMFVLDEKCMSFTGEWCRACNLEATNHERIKGMLFSSSSEATSVKDGFLSFKPFSNIPMGCDLPMGMRIMHDSYVFCYLICTFVAVLISKLHQAKDPPSPTQVWRIRCLIRLYVGYLLFTLSDAMNTVKSTLSFNQWYIIYYSDLQVWETAQDPWSSGMTDLARPISSSSSSSSSSSALGLARPAGGGSRWSNLWATASGTGDQDAQVAEVASRIAQIPRLYPFLFNHRMLSEAQFARGQPPAAAAAAAEYNDQGWAVLQRYLHFIPLNPSTNNVGRMYAMYGQPGVISMLRDPPMCCSRQLALRRGGGDDSDEGGRNDSRGIASNASMLYIDRRKFVHRLCTGLELNFPLASNVRDIVSSFSRGGGAFSGGSSSIPRNSWMLRTILSRLWNFYQ